MRAGAFALTLLLSSFLLFLVQPMFARFALPVFGGGSGVWSVCLLFFQSILLLGYLYAHGLARLRSLRVQVLGHSLLLLLSLGVLPNAGSMSSTPGQLPAIDLLWLLLRSVGLPCLLMSASAPLLQHWFAQVRGHSPYRLYAVSNLGSLLGLLSYPLVVEPLTGLHLQAIFWNGGYLVLVAGCLLCAGLVFRSRGEQAVAARSHEPVDRPALGLRLLWLGLSGAGVLLLLSVTTELTTNLMPMPLLWVLPLSLYLVSFIWCFATELPYRRRRWLSLFSLAILPTLWLPAIEPLVGVWPAVVISCLCLFSGCMICHGELARLKPAHDHLSLYYLFLALGGVLGGAFVNFAAPLLFDRYWELAMALFGIFILTGLCTGRVRPAAKTTRRANPLGLPMQERSGLSLGIWLVWALGGSAGIFLGTLPLRAQDGTLAAARSFYGRLSVQETRESRFLLHGSIRHGSQHRSDQRKGEPTLYYSTDSALGLALAHPVYRMPGRHVGVVGLGVGTIASYGRVTDRIRFYELDPLVQSFAERYFSFLGDSPAQIQVVLGDGRMSLEREWSAHGSNDFDILVIDAFSSDAVPTHLLTREAFDLYWRHLSQEGTLAVHITNSFLDLAPVVHAQARALGKEMLLFRSEPSELSSSGSTWALVTGNRKLIEDPRVQSRSTSTPDTSMRPWTDDYSNVLQVLQ